MGNLNFKRKGIVYEPLCSWRTDSITEVGIYQGARGSNPELDFIVKYKEEGKRLRTPSHTHWIVDLLIKSELDKEVLSYYIRDLISMYDEMKPFVTLEERSNYILVNPSIMDIKYSMFNERGCYSISTLTSFIELFSKCEKQGEDAFMFRGLLVLIEEYCKGLKDYYQVVGYSKRV
jgi:hypothetical protein